MFGLHAIMDISMIFSRQEFTEHDHGVELEKERNTSVYF